MGFGKQALSLEPPGAAYPLWSYQVAIDLDHFSAVVDHVQHQSAAAVAPLTDRPRPLTTSSTGAKTFSDLAATSYGSEDQMVTRAGPGLRARTARKYSSRNDPQLTLHDRHRPR